MARTSRPNPLPALLVALGAVAAILIGCGNDSGKGRLLSTQEASNLQDTLTRIQQDVAAKNCTAAEQEVTALQQDVDSIRRLNGRLRSALRASSRRLESLVTDSCQTAPAPVQTQTQTTPTETGTTGPGKAKKEKKPKPEKPPKGTTTNPGGQSPPGQQGGGGGAGVPGESGGNGTTSP